MLASRRVPAKHNSGCRFPTHSHPGHCLHRRTAPTASRAAEGRGTAPRLAASQQGDRLLKALGSGLVHETRYDFRGPLSSGAFSTGLQYSILYSSVQYSWLQQASRKI